MALLATGTPRKSGFFKASAPNYRDFSSPPNGDYVRYVDGLMRWAEEEQERLRLQALSDKARSQRDSHWGRSSAPTSGMQGAQVQAQRQAQPGSVDSPMERWKRKAQASAAKLRQAQTAAGSGARTAPQAQSKPKPKQSVPLVLVMMAIFVLTGIFASSLLPVVIIGWVVFNVIRAVRAASSAGKS